MNKIGKVKNNGVPISHDNTFDSLHPVPSCALQSERNRDREEGSELSMQLQEIVTHLPHSQQSRQQQREGSLSPSLLSVLHSLAIFFLFCCFIFLSSSLQNLCEKVEIVECMMKKKDSIATDNTCEMAVLKKIHLSPCSKFAVVLDVH